MGEKSLPIALINQFALRHPRFWEDAEIFIRGKNNGDLPSWDDICYIPITATLACANGGRGQHTDDELLDAAIGAALAPWRLSKEIYTFDKDFSELLFEQAEDIRIPVEVLYRLPFLCIYLDVKITNAYGITYAGFFVHFEHDPYTKEKELRFLFIPPEGSINDIWEFALHLIPNGTISEGVMASVQRSLELAREKRIRYFVDTEFITATTELISRALQLVLYICSENADISVDTERPPRRAEIIIDKYREVRTHRVGNSIGIKIRQFGQKHPQSTKSVGSTQLGTPKAPHARRGHWHHYWTGSEKQTNRKLILKWTAPTYIHADDPDEVGLTINKVAKPSKEPEQLL